MKREPSGRALITRYREHYGIPEDVSLSEDMILRHWDLEKRLRHELLNSTSENRWDVFEASYTRLYAELEWLNRLCGQACAGDIHANEYRNWLGILGAPPLKIYEVGSGKGELVNYLADQGFDCKGTEITKERGSKWTVPNPNLTWGTSDGIHLDQFEPLEHYDAVISNHVIEHFHPDDVLEHFKNVRSILVPGGRYIFATPCALVGPSDVSVVFEHDRPMGMHLKEYSYGELSSLLKDAGFSTVSAPLRLPKNLRHLLKPKVSRLYLLYLIFLDRLLSLVSSHSVRRKLARQAKLLLFAANLMLVAKK